MRTDLLASAAQTVTAALPASSGGKAAGGAAGPFSGVFQDAMGNLQALERQASSAVDGLVSGRGVDVHAAMIATEKSDLAFEMALAVRGKMVSAYQTMMGVQF